MVYVPAKLYDIDVVAPYACCSRHRPASCKSLLVWNKSE